MCLSTSTTSTISRLFLSAVVDYNFKHTTVLQSNHKTILIGKGYWYRQDSKDRALTSLSRVMGFLPNSAIVHCVFLVESFEIKWSNLSINFMEAVIKC